MTEFTLTDEQRKVARSRAYDALVVLPQYNEAFAPWYDAGKIAEAILAEVGPLIAAQALRDAAERLDGLQTPESGYPRDIPLILNGWADQIDGEE